MTWCAGVGGVLRETESERKGGGGGEGREEGEEGERREEVREVCGQCEPCGGVSLGPGPVTSPIHQLFLGLIR